MAEEHRIPNLVWDTIQHDKLCIAFSVHGRQPPTNEEASEYFTWGKDLQNRFFNNGVIRGLDGCILRGVVYSAGGGFTNAQRRMFAERIGEFPVQQAFVTSSRPIRLIATAVCFFSKQPIKVFSPTDWNSAFDWLDLDVATCIKVAARLETLIKKVDLRSSVKIPSFKPQGV